MVGQSTRGCREGQFPYLTPHLIDHNKMLIPITVLCRIHSVTTPVLRVEAINRQQISRVTKTSVWAKNCDRKSIRPKGYPVPTPECFMTFRATDGSRNGDMETTFGLVDVSLGLQGQISLCSDRPDSVRVTLLKGISKQKVHRVHSKHKSRVLRNLQNPILLRFGRDPATPEQVSSDPSLAGVRLRRDQTIS